jgi:CheY-like chemotaxis protein
MNFASSSNSHLAHILLVDDNKLGLAARKAVLEELGYQIATAGSAADGLKRFAETGFDLIITDYKMPRMNGVQLIERIRIQNPAIPIILLSGFADALGLDQKNTGADAVIQKSANEVAHMVRAVRKLLRPKKPAASYRATRQKRKSG